MSPQMMLHTIGRVHANAGAFRVEIEANYRQGLVALDGFSHLLVLWWADQVSRGDTETLIEKPYRNGPEQVGVFATRAEARPNPLLVSVVAIEHIDGGSGRVTVPWIDAAHGSPVLDLKPYQPCVDRVRDAQVPAWCADWPQWYEDSAMFDWASVLTFE